MDFLYEVYMDNIEEITKRVEDTQKEVVAKADEATEQRKSWRKQINDYEAAIASKEATIKLL